jgi:hypothetical protein
MYFIILGLLLLNTVKCFSIYDISTLNVRNNIYKFITDKEKYCIISNFNNEYNIDLDKVIITGYTLNTNGCPVIPLHQDNTIIKNPYISFILLEKINNKLYKRRIIFKGMLKKISDNVNYYGDIPSKESLIYKEKYIRENNNAGWVDSPFVDMYILNDIYKIKYLYDNNFEKNININSYKQNFINYLLKK